MCVRASRLTHRSCRNAHYYLVNEIWLRSPFIKDLIDRRRLKHARPPSPFVRFALLSVLPLPTFFSPFPLSLPLNKLLSLYFFSLLLPAPVIKFASTSLFLCTAVTCVHLFPHLNCIVAKLDSVSFYICISVVFEFSGPSFYTAYVYIPSILFSWVPIRNIINRHPPYPSIYLPIRLSFSPLSFFF